MCCSQDGFTMHSTKSSEGKEARWTHLHASPHCEVPAAEASERNAIADRTHPILVAGFMLCGCLGFAPISKPSLVISSFVRARSDVPMSPIEREEEDGRCVKNSKKVKEQTKHSN